MPETAKKTRKVRRNYEKELKELALYCRIKADVLQTFDLPENTPEKNAPIVAAYEAYRDVLDRLEPKA